MCWLSRLFSSNREQPSPSDIVPGSSITLRGNAVTLNLEKLNIPFTKPPKVWIPHVVGTGSMDPVMDRGHHNLLIAGADAQNQKILVGFLKVGDVAVYQHAYLYVIHRIVKIEQDDKGRRFTFRGDNNLANDPHPVRDEHIQWLSIGTIY